MVRALRSAARQLQENTTEAALVAGTTLLLAALAIAATHSALTPDRTSTLRLPLGSLSSIVTPGRVVTLVALLAAVLVLARAARARASVAVLAATVAFAFSGMHTDAFFAPPSTWGQQWQSYYGTNGNLTESSQLAANLREGKGYKLDDGSVDTYRMPGYTVLVAAAGIAGGDSPRDFQSVAADMIWLQMLLTSAALGVFAYVAASRLSRPVLVVLLFVLVSLPTNVQLTQGDSMIFASGLLVTSALFPFLDRARSDQARWRDVVLLHLAFAGYYLIRTDVVFAWAAVSLIVHWRRWQHIAVWVALFVAIGGGFGLYARTHGSEFTFGTNNTGHVAFVGLWQVPHSRFAWEPADASYDQWIRAHGYTYRGPGANAFAEKEILRFYATYPGYVTSMAIYKALYFFDYTGVADDYAESPLPEVQETRHILTNGGLLLLAGAMLMALLIGYRRYETVLLGWAAWFVLPVFFFVQVDNRFTLFEAGSFAIAAIPLLGDAGFYRALASRVRVTAPIAVALIALWIARGSIEHAFVNWDGFRYWTPILDPAHSTLAVYKR